VPSHAAIYDAEGAQYQLYSDHDVSVDNYEFCEKRGADSWWWLRSPCALDSYRFLVVLFDGDWDAGTGRADHDCGVSPGFCF
jgi:hypothetical protein